MFCKISMFQAHKKIEIKIELRQGAKPYKSLPEFIVKDGKVWELC